MKAIKADKSRPPKPHKLAYRLEFDRRLSGHETHVTFVTDGTNVTGAIDAQLW
jgi:hypothetical protein